MSKNILFINIRDNCVLLMKSTKISENWAYNFLIKIWLLQSPLPQVKKSICRGLVLWSFGNTGYRYSTFKTDKKGGQWENFSASIVSGCASPATTVFRKLSVLRAVNGEEIQCFCEAGRERIKTFWRIYTLDQTPKNMVMIVIRLQLFKGDQNNENLTKLEHTYTPLHPPHTHTHNPTDGFPVT